MAGNLSPPPPTIKDEPKVSHRPLIETTDLFKIEPQPIKQENAANLSEEQKADRDQIDVETCSSGSSEKREENVISESNVDDDDYIDENRLTIDDSI